MFVCAYVSFLCCASALRLSLSLSLSIYLSIYLPPSFSLTLCVYVCVCVCAFHRKLALKAFTKSAAYDAAIAEWMEGAVKQEEREEREKRKREHTAASDTTQEMTEMEVEEEPQTVVRAYRKAMKLKYGCNPHQKPAGELT